MRRACRIEVSLLKPARNTKKVARKCITSLADRCVVAVAVVVARLHRMKKESSDVARVMLRLSTEYPGDLGIMTPLVLNLLQLKTGQAFFMAVDEPHAYLRGDILEVRAQ